MTKTKIKQHEPEQKPPPVLEQRDAIPPPQTLSAVGYPPPWAVKELVAGRFSVVASNGRVLMAVDVLNKPVVESLVSTINNYTAFRAACAPIRDRYRKLEAGGEDGGAAWFANGKEKFSERFAGLSLDKQAVIAIVFAMGDL